MRFLEIQQMVALLIVKYDTTNLIICNILTDDATDERFVFFAQNTTVCQLYKQVGRRCNEYVAESLKLRYIFC